MKKTLLKAAFILIAQFSILSSHICSAQIITTIAGNGTAGFSGDGGQANAAELNQPNDIAFDLAGNIFIADESNNRIRKITKSTGIITTIAGNGTLGFAGDGGQASAAELYYPHNITFDALGNLYISDNSARIRKVNTAGMIITIAGNGTNGYSGDGGQATAAEFFGQQGVRVDLAGNIYVADTDNSRIRKINTAGIITTFAGNGSNANSGDGNTATAASLNAPEGITFDALGNLYISGQGSCVRIINTSGIINTFAGTGNGGFSGDGGLATNAYLYWNYGVASDLAGNVYISDTDNSRIRKVNTTGIINTIAGSGTPGVGNGSYGGDNGIATNAGLNTPDGLAVDASGNLYIADKLNNRIRMICNSADNVSGIITAPSAAPVTAGQVYVFRPNPIHNGLLDTAGYTNIQANGTYTFTNLPFANYYIEAKADTNTYPTAVGTYYSTHANNYQWDSAIFINHRGCANNSYSGYNITVIETPAQTGTGVISGNITANASFGHRLAGGYNNVMGAVKSVDVKLGKKPAGGCTNRTSSDAAGNYSFTGLDTGTYVVYVDIPNFTDTIVNLHVTPTNSVYTNVNYCVDSVKVHYCAAVTGISQYSNLNANISIYPNPNNGSFTISFRHAELVSASNQQTLNQVQGDDVSIEVYNIIGECVQKQMIMSSNSQINLAAFANGIYQLRVLKNNRPAYQTKIIKQE